MWSQINIHQIILPVLYTLQQTKQTYMDLEIKNRRLQHLLLHLHKILYNRLSLENLRILSQTHINMCIQ